MSVAFKLSRCFVTRGFPLRPPVFTFFLKLGFAIFTGALTRRHVAGLNPYVSPELAFEYHYFFMRKCALA